ncbi:MAG: hypothetical protein GY841_18045 [FCB group bacterium]|nr:hypothetical protein [FCB group bacterium]
MAQIAMAGFRSDCLPGESVPIYQKRIDNPCRSCKFSARDKKHSDCMACQSPQSYLSAIEYNDPSLIIQPNPPDPPTPQIRKEEELDLMCTYPKCTNNARYATPQYCQRHWMRQHYRVTHGLPADDKYLDLVGMAYVKAITADGWERTPGGKWRLKDALS